MHYVDQIDYLFQEKGKYPNEVQLLRVGSWSHPFYGDFDITQSNLIELKQNFDKKVRGVDIFLDVEHMPDKGATAKFTELVVRGSELWGVVEWTDWGREILDKKLFKYISPEFQENYKDPESNVKYGYVLLGAALTNRPFIKKMQPVEAVAFSERVDVGKIRFYTQAKQRRVSDMELKDVLGALGLKEEATIEEVNAKVVTLSENKDLAAVAKVLELKEDATMEEVTTKIGELGNTEGVVLSEADLKSLKEKAEAGEQAAKELKEMKANGEVDKAMRAGKITPKTQAWAKEYALKDPKGFAAFVKDAPKVLNITPQGSEHEGQDNDTSTEEGARKDLHEKAVKIQEEKKCTYDVAIKQARKELKEAKK